MKIFRTIIYNLWTKKNSIAKWQLNVFGVVFLATGFIFGSYFTLKGIMNALAAGAPWIQTDWSGGSGASTTNQYTAGSNIDATTTAGQLTLQTVVGWSGSYTSWSRRQLVTITNSGSGQTDYQVRLPITYDSDMQADFDDLRFANASGTALDYWLETKTDNTSAIVWVEVDTVAGASDTSVYVYYGNAAVNSASNGFNAFPLFDDFNDNVFDTAKWTKIDPRSKMSEANGKLNFIYGSGAGNWDAAIYGVQSFTRDDWSFEWDQRWTSDYASYDAFMFGWKDDGSGVSYANLVYGYYNQGDGNCTVNCSSPGSYEDGILRGNTISWNNNTDYNLRLRMRSSGGAYYEKSTNNGNTWTTDYTSAYSTEATLHPAWVHYSGDYVVDNVRVRKWMSSEPTNSMGSEENKYPSSATMTSNIYDTGILSAWGDLTYTATTPANTAVTVKVRAGNVSNLSDATAWTSCSAASSGVDLTGDCTLDGKQYVQYQVVLTTTDSITTPTFSDISIDFSAYDTDPPATNASSIKMYTASSKVKEIPAFSGGTVYWNNAVKPYFEWTLGADNSGGSGLLGYCLYLGTDPTGNPNGAKGILGDTSPIAIPTGSNCQFIIGPSGVFDSSISGYIKTAMVDDEVYALNIKAIDLAGNVFLGDPAQFKFKQDSTPPSNPAYISLPGDWISSKAVTVTWPTSGGDAAQDSASQVVGMQYRIGSSGTWYGVNHSGTQDATDLLDHTSGRYSMVEIPDYTSLGEGSNVIYFRTWDNAGNVNTNPVFGTIKLNTTAPSIPRNLMVSPEDNDTNSYSFSWSAPAIYTGQSTNITYCYTANTLPSALNCNFTVAGATTLVADAYANQPGTNTLYLVAKDEAGNVNYEVYASTTFTYSGSAPGISRSLDIADVSVKATESWKLVLSWEAPESIGSGVENYKIYHSENGTNFSLQSTVTGISYVDTGLTQKTHYYKIKACDSANNCGAYSGIVSLYPDGKFIEAASLVDGPIASAVTTKRATLSWSTDRKSDSKVSYGTKSGSYKDEESSNSAQTISHEIKLTSLEPGTTYYYKAKWTDEDGNTGESKEKTFETDPAPTVSSVAATNVSISSGLISFKIKNSNIARIYYGESTSYGGVVSMTTSTVESKYTIPLEGLKDGTDYHYKLQLEDAEKDKYDFEDHVFTTLPRPKISNVRIQQVKNTAQPTALISWDTNTEVSSIVTYYPEGDTSQSRDEVDVKLIAGEHKTIIRNLLPQTNYILVVKGVDKVGNEATSDNQKITTATDTRPPQISNVSIKGSNISGQSSQSSLTQLVVTWDTDEVATSQVEFGEGTGDTYSQKTQEDTNLTNNHLVIITNLSPSKVYHLRILSKDNVGNLAKSIDTVTITPKNTDNAFDLVIGSLQEVFGFLGRIQ